MVRTHESTPFGNPSYYPTHLNYPGNWNKQTTKQFQKKLERRPLDGIRGSAKMSKRAGVRESEKMHSDPLEIRKKSRQNPEGSQ
jgi:hypothetical protein